MSNDPKPAPQSMRRSGERPKPELIIRGGLHAEGTGFPPARQTLPGKPDFVFSEVHAAVLGKLLASGTANCRNVQVPKHAKLFGVITIGGNF